jgi:hypothetical protein
VSASDLRGDGRRDGSSTQWRNAGTGLCVDGRQERARGADFDLHSLLPSHDQSRGINHLGSSAMPSSDLPTSYGRSARVRAVMSLVCASVLSPD